MSELKKLPIGIENFTEIRRDGFYYVDKTKLIEELLDQWGKANLFTRPRRFGKSINMSMLQSFFEIGTDKTLFDGLYIANNRKLCDEYMGKYPVISISLKSVSADNFEDATALLNEVIREAVLKCQFLFESDRLTEIDKEEYRRLFQEKMTKHTLCISLRKLTGLLEKHYRQKVIVLIDEYDVPLAKANERGYYDEMVLLIRNLFENVLKTNDSLKFAVLTGCLRVAKESIFTGLNNFRVSSITDVEYEEFYGFTDAEVREMLHYYGQDEHYETVKEWYDGYRFGNTDVYCPWDVINYCADHRKNPAMPPQNYWLNTSGNDVIYHFIDGPLKQQKMTKTELEQLVDGGTVQKELSQELTYKELYSSANHLWSALFMTGYLTKHGEPDGKRYNLAIPNREIRNIITEHILTRFQMDVGKDGEMVNMFCNALKDGKPELVEKILTSYMEKTISVRDTFVKKPTKENFYHGMLLGILSFKGDWTVKSNKESGNGFSDIMIRMDDSDIGISIEVKYAENNEEAECQKALRQIDEKRYATELKQEGISRILKYGIVCNRKRCYVMLNNH